MLLNLHSIQFFTRLHLPKRPIPVPMITATALVILRDHSLWATSFLTFGCPFHTLFREQNRFAYSFVKLILTYWNAWDAVRQSYIRHQPRILAIIRSRCDRDRIVLDHSTALTTESGLLECPDCPKWPWCRVLLSSILWQCRTQSRNRLKYISHAPNKSRYWRSYQIFSIYGRDIDLDLVPDRQWNIMQKGEGFELTAQMNAVTANEERHIQNSIYTERKVQERVGNSGIFQLTNTLAGT